MNYLNSYIVFFVSAIFALVHADGLLMPTNETYPGDFLRNRITRVTVQIDGVIARTSVYQEFVNESDEVTDAVYSFPLPADARATQFLYWHDDLIYQAVLKVREQATNPGTGEGGVVAEVNKYIGRNGIKIALRDIEPGSVQKVQLDFISLCDFYQGECSYEYPLASGDFITTPLDLVEFDITVSSSAEINAYDITSHADYRTISSDLYSVHLQMTASKIYVNQDFHFYYRTHQEALGTDFYSIAGDTTDGHFVLLIRPPNQAAADSILPRRLIFMLSNSSGMFGAKLAQSITAIKNGLSQLDSTDLFNIVVFNYYAAAWTGSPVPADSNNIRAAELYLDSVSPASGSRIDTGLDLCLDQIADNDYTNAIIVFTDGFAVTDPVAIQNKNTYRTGIFPIAIGDDFDFARLEMLAAFNYGFVTYIDYDDNMKDKMNRVISQVTHPIIKSVQFEYGRADISDVLPTALPATYAGSYFFTTGRYKNPGVSAFSLGGISVTGPVVYDFLLDFSSDTDSPKFAEHIWAKQKIEFLEWQIEIYGETTELKAELIEISLKYNIRCRYTAYIADYETEYTSVMPESLSETHVPYSFIQLAYPNPFNPRTAIQVYLSAQDIRQGRCVLRIYNILGQLVFEVDLAHLGAGIHTIFFNGTDLYGRTLPSGTYIAVLQSGSRVSTRRIVLLR